MAMKIATAFFKLTMLTSLIYSFSIYIRNILHFRSKKGPHLRSSFIENPNLVRAYFPEAVGSFGVSLNPSFR